MATQQPLFHSEAAVRDIVLQFPKSADYFKANRIDFCCGGAKPLGTAAEERGLDKDAVIQELYRLLEEYPVLEEDLRWTEASTPELIDHIVNKHHRYLREELPLIQQNVTKVFRVHGGDSPHLAELHALFSSLKKELLEHTAKEEEQQFPMLLELDRLGSAQGVQDVQAALNELEDEHDQAGELLRQIRNVTNDFTPPEGACTTYRLTYARLEELEGMTFEHVHLENNVLFPRYI